MQIDRTDNTATQSPGGRRAGFTLIEMLISVTLVLLMMVMFAEIFELASNAMTLQQALADNDQQVRSFTTVFRSDLQKRTFRNVVPYHPLERQHTELDAIPASARQGYIYVSTNDPDNAVDNLLQFTVRSTINLENGDETPYFGAAVPLVQRVSGSTVRLPGDIPQNVRRNSRQPEHDDGELQLNFATASTAAEIAYFVRGGRLYRRTVLVRDPVTVAGSQDPQPRVTWDSFNGESFAEPPRYFAHSGTSAQASAPVGFYWKFDPQSGGAVPSDDYWADFSHSAYWDLSNGGAMLLGTRALRNDRSPTDPALGLTQAFQDPMSPMTPRCYRFGFDQTSGISREFSRSDPGVGRPDFFFVGRYTAEEMSHIDFNFPQNPSADDNMDMMSVGGANPFSYNDAPVVSDVNGDGIVDEFVGGARRGEDLLLSNVHAFEIELWDHRLGQFVQPGHSLKNAAGIEGDYHRERNLQLAQSAVIVPSDSPGVWDGTVPGWTGRIFDTWHRENDLDNDKTTLDSVPPYRALTFYPPGSSIGPTLDHWEPDPQPNDPNAPDPQYSVGDRVFPTAQIPVPEPDRDPNKNEPPDTGPTDFSFYYECIERGTSQVSEDENDNGQLDGNDVPDDGVFDEDTNDNGWLDTFEPEWPAVDGAVVERTVPTEPRWVARSNVRPVRAIRIRIRFLHESSGQMRQLSLIHSLID